MGTLGPASIVVVEFPFSDLTRVMLRPAVVLIDVGQGDWLLCQIISNPHADPQAVGIEADDILIGELARLSFARPTKLFTANASLITKQVAVLKDDTFSEIVLTTIRALQQVVPQ